MLRLSSNFIESLLRTSSRHWIDQVKHHNVDIFAYNTLVMPYQSGQHKSLFVVLGANNIKDYMKRSFTGTRPCILHILPHATSNRSHLHAYNQVSLTICTWLNALWRNSQCNGDYESMPFTHRSMPTSRPFGKFSFHDNLTMHKQANQLMQKYVSVSALSNTNHRCWSLLVEICTFVGIHGCRHSE